MTALLSPLFLILALVWPLLVWCLAAIHQGRRRAWEAWTGRENSLPPSWWVLRLGWTCLGAAYLWLLLGLPIRASWMGLLLPPLTLTGTLIWRGMRSQLQRLLLGTGTLEVLPSDRRHPEWIGLRLTLVAGAVAGFASGLRTVPLLQAHPDAPPAVLLALLEYGTRAFLITFAAAALLYGIEAFAVLSRGRNALAQVRDQALRARLAPHFIFNALATLKAQMRRDVGEAEAMTDRLAALFRQVLEVSEASTIPLRQELAFVEAYLGIQRARLGERLQIRFDIPEALLEAQLPPLSLQVLVENAVKHGVAPLEEGGLVRVSARRLPARDGWDLEVRVSDPGTGLGAEPGTGTALATLRQRLANPEDLHLIRMEPGFAASFRWRQA